VLDLQDGGPAQHRLQKSRQFNSEVPRNLNGPQERFKSFQCKSLTSPSLKPVEQPADFVANQETIFSVFGIFLDAKGGIVWPHAPGGPLPL
jgi:hypothetical protein